MRRSAVVVLVLGVLLVLALPFAAYGQDMANYIVVKPGVYIPSGDLDDADFDTGFNIEGVLGHYYHPNFAAELGVGYFETESDVAGDEGDVWVIPVTISGKGVYPLYGGEIYAGAGVGIYFASIEAKVAGLGTDDDDDIVFGAHVMVGGNVDVAEDIFLGIEGKYIFTDETDVTLLGMPVESDLNGFTVTGNLGIRF